MSNTTTATFTDLVSGWPQAALVTDSITSFSLSAPVVALEWLAKACTWSTIWKVLIFTLILANFKNFPLIYHLRILNGVRFLLKSQRPPKALQPAQIFQPLITSSRASLLETDVFGHKSNSTYFSDVDVARVHLLTTLFSRAIEKIRGGTTMNGLSGKPSSAFTIPLGGVSCTFRRELKPYQTYDMWTRILSWDDKWFYIVTHFVKQGAKIEPREFTLYPRQNSVVSSSNTSRHGSIASIHHSQDEPTRKERSPVCASAMSKIVFKNGRATIAPEKMLEAAGLLPPKAVEGTSNPACNLADARAGADDSEISPLDTSCLGQKVEGSQPATPERRGSIQEMGFTLTRDDIEAERQRGMRLAKLLAGQTELEHELHDEVALGRHYDGYGFEGVVATLAQLGKLSRYQLL